MAEDSRDVAKKIAQWNQRIFSISDTEPVKKVTVARSTQSLTTQSPSWKGFQQGQLASKLSDSRRSFTAVPTLERSVPQKTRSRHSSVQHRQVKVPPESSVQHSQVKIPPEKPSRPKHGPSPLPRSPPQTTSPGLDAERLTTRRKKQQETLFFGDGLYDLSTEHNEEVSQFKDSLARLRQQYSCMDTTTNPGHICSPEVPWMPIGHSTLTLTVSTATHPRPLTVSVDASTTVADCLHQVTEAERTAALGVDRPSSRSLIMFTGRSNAEVSELARPDFGSLGNDISPLSSSCHSGVPKRQSQGGIQSTHNRRSMTFACPLTEGLECSGSFMTASDSTRTPSIVSRSFSIANKIPSAIKSSPSSMSASVSTSYSTVSSTSSTTNRTSSSIKTSSSVEDSDTFSVGSRCSQDSMHDEALMLKVAGRTEILNPTVAIGHYQYVHRCCRFNKPIHLELIRGGSMTSTFSRTGEDDAYDSRAQRFASFMPIAETTSISKRGLDVLTDTFGKECDRLIAADAVDMQVHCDRVIQTAKAFVVSLASVESVALTEVLTYLRCVCMAAVQSKDVQNINKAVTSLREVIAEEVKTYCQAFELGVNQQLIDVSSPGVTLLELPENFQLAVQVCSAHRLRSKEPLGVMVSLEHAGQLLSQPVKTELVAPSDKMFLESIIWNSWFDLIPLVDVPREAMLRFVLFKQPDTDYDRDQAQTPGLSPIQEGVQPIGCVAVPIFNFQGGLVTGKQMLGMWPYNQYPPYGFVSSNIIDKDSTIIQFKIRPANCEVTFPSPDPFETMESSIHQRSQEPFKDSVDHAIRVMMRKGTADSLSDREKKWLWEQRYHCWRHVCTTSPHSLGIFLSAVPSWSACDAGNAHALARSWTSIEPTDALGLLDGQVADSVIRGIASEKLRAYPDYLLCDILPQLLQAVKFDQSHLSSLVLMLFQRALCSVTVAHRLYWNIHIMRTDQFFGKRFDLLHAGLQVLVGSALRTELDKELRLMGKLNIIAKEFKQVHPASRSGVLPMLLEKYLADAEWPLRLPLDAGMEVSGLNLEKCSYFSSNAAPLKLTFTNVNPDMPDISCIFKVGDDLRQDQIVLQMLRIMDNLWQQDGLDLRIITYQCLAFNEDSGILEIVDSAATMREIQTIDGVTGSFKNSALLTWLSHHNTSQSALSLAVQNFTLSCAGFCVATYILGVCDRHNDNIMLRRSGHLFHIDFGKFLGNAQKFGSFKRDRTPFVLTPDMAYVINNGEEISPNFQEFVDTCCRAFNILRHHASHVANILSLMRTSGMEELSQPEDVKYVVDALMPNLTDIEATTAFTRMIEESLKNWFTKFNFFIHNLGQMKSSTAELESPLLGFCPKNYQVLQTGAVVSAQIQQFIRKDVPETHYIYAIEVVWDDSIDLPGPNCNTVYRRFREFYELHSKLQELVGPNFELPSLPGKILLRRSNTDEVAAKRMELLNIYMMKLLSLYDFVSQSDLVVTFFSHFVRDDTDNEVEKYASSSQGQVSGSIKLSLTYMMHAQKLIVVIGHGKQLARTATSTLPDPYVKLYIIPDPLKTTKKKTRVMKNTQHPTFNESFKFDLSSFSKVSLQDRQLQVTVWHHETLSKHFLGCVHIDMSTILKLKTEETVTEWHKLQPMFS